MVAFSSDWLCNDRCDLGRAIRFLVFGFSWMADQIHNSQGFRAKSSSTCYPFLLGFSYGRLYIRQHMGVDWYAV